MTKALSTTYIYLYIYSLLSLPCLYCLSVTQSMKKTCVISQSGGTLIDSSWKHVRGWERVTEGRREVERDEGVGWLTGKISCGLSEPSHWKVRWQPSDTDTHTESASSTRILIIHTDTHITQPAYWHTPHTQTHSGIASKEICQFVKLTEWCKFPPLAL